MALGLQARVKPCTQLLTMHYDCFIWQVLLQPGDGSYTRRYQWLYDTVI